MDIKQLKMEIEAGILSDDQMIWKVDFHNVWGKVSNESSWFIAKQYIERIAKDKGLTIKYIDSFDEVGTTGFIEDKNLYIYKVEELKDFKVVPNSIIVCSKTSRDDAIVFPKLETWQFLDLIKTIVPGMEQVDLEWLLTQYEFTYGRETWVKYSKLWNDLKKISIFDESIQSAVFNELYEDGEYKTTTNLTIFDLTNAIEARDPQQALEVLKVLDYIDSEPQLWLARILIANFKRLIDIKLNPKSNRKDMGISERQYNFLKKNRCMLYSDVELINIYKFLTEVEKGFKFDGLSNDHIIEYIVCKILGGGV